MITQQVPEPLRLFCFPKSPGTSLQKALLFQVTYTKLPKKWKAAQVTFLGSQNISARSVKTRVLYQCLSTAAILSLSVQEEIHQLPDELQATLCLAFG